MSETPNSNLSACLVIVNICTLTIPCKTLLLSLWRSSLGRSETCLRLSRKPTHVHLIKVVCVTFILHQGKPFLKHLELKTCGWHDGRHLGNFCCRVWAIIKILVSSCKSYDLMSPLEEQVYHIKICSYI